MKTTPDGEKVGGLSFIAGVYFFLHLIQYNPKFSQPRFFLFFFFKYLPNLFLGSKNGGF